MVLAFKQPKQASARAMLRQPFASKAGPGIQPKLQIGGVNDPLEREADAVADAVMCKPPGPVDVSDANGELPSRACAKCSGSDPHELLQAKADAAHAPQAGARASVPLDAQINAARRGGGSALSQNFRATMEPRFDADFSAVRLHTDPSAAALAKQLDARAFTVGNDVFFGSGQYQPEAGEGQRLLAHELTHTIQQRSPSSVWSNSRLRIQRAPASTMAPMAPAKSKPSCAPGALDVVLNVASQQGIAPTDEDRIATLVSCPGLIDEISEDKIAEQGMWLASMLLDHGHVELGRKMLARMTGNQVSRFWRRDISQKIGSVDPVIAQNMIDQAVRAALDHEHPLAMEILASVYNVTQIALFQASDELVNSAVYGAISQDEFEVWQEILAQIFALYPALIRHSMTKGDRQREKEYRREWQVIRADLLTEHTIKETPPMRSMMGVPPRRGPNDVGPIVIGVANFETSEKAILTTGEEKEIPTSFEIRGIGSGTQLAKPVDSEHASLFNSTLTDTMTSAVTDLADQQDLVTQIYALPSVRAAFPDGPPNLRDREERIRVWTALYDADIPRSMALRGTMDVIARYLRHYTLHSSWDFSDSGTTYLGRDMPIDLAGRLLLDCGVYAMSVATELFAAVKRSGKGTLRAEIYIVPAHVVLVLFHPTTDEFYLVNNDTIAGPEKIPKNIKGVDDPLLGMVATAFAGVLGKGRDPVTDIMAPYGRVKMGSTDDYDEQEFNHRYWERYSAASQGYSALQNGDYSRHPEDLDKLTPTEMYRKEMGEYRVFSKTLHDSLKPYTSVVGETDDDKVKEIENDFRSDPTNPLSTALKLLEIYAPYGPASATRGGTGLAVAPRGGSSARERRAEAVIEPELVPGKAAPHLFHTELETDGHFANPLVTLQAILRRMLQARGITKPTPTSGDPLEIMAVALNRTFGG